MGAFQPFPAVVPLLVDANDPAELRRYINDLITYINTIVFGDNAAAGSLLKVNNLSDVNSVSLARSNLGLGTAATHAATDFDAAGAAAAVLASSLQINNNLSDLNSASAARTNLGLGSAATHSAADFDPAGAAAARAAQGINGDITALTGLSITTNITANHTVVAGDQTLECDATSGALTVVYAPAVAAGRVVIIKVDATFNPVNISDGTNVIYSLVAPANGLMQAVTAYTNGAALRVF